ncbi:GNAT family N-acetyltransferase [Nocardia huaxiensis]|uniref:GNAT family N-acetyltransferase n=1 Tax=Nocardia huaxiensis TaxID=2755382 RepID=A0A7D6V8W8_9NOCA|nr:GNAT family N-acetyltransferase [Nocardia huaxiensis]QLY30521.1 GNAT family N-acetyltransferase [Nocardia huaxiensis]UFS95879.1 GNAT family N-acetyltransferase [Nocardia huaxiensis]
MDTQLLVRRAESSEADEVARVFALAGADEVVTSWVMEDAGDIAEQYRDKYVPELIEKALREDEVWLAGTESEIWAVSLWQQVSSLDRAHREAAELRALAGQFPAVRPFQRIATVTEAVTAAHPIEFPHRYLHVIVTLPEHRGKGAGAAIITDRIKAEPSLPAYLEASTERSARLYERCGFAHTGTPIVLPDNGPTLRPMWFQG